MLCHLRIRGRQVIQAGRRVDAVAHREAVRRLRQPPPELSEAASRVTALGVHQPRRLPCDRSSRRAAAVRGAARLAHQHPAQTARREGGISPASSPASKSVSTTNRHVMCILPDWSQGCTTSACLVSAGCQRIAVPQDSTDVQRVSGPVLWAVLIQCYHVDPCATAPPPHVATH